MKKIIRILGVLLVSAFMLLPLKTNAQEPEWSQKLELGDSVSSAIAKVEDGVVVMQYEGTASASNLLIKYDFNGKKIWEKDNDYGYYIESVSDGFIVWSETKITKFDKGGNVLWNKDVELQETSDTNGYMAGLGNKLLEVNNNYIIFQTHVVSNPRNDFFKFDSAGNLVSRTKSKDLFTTNNISVNDYRIRGVGKTADGNGFFLLYGEYDTSEFYINSFTTDFVLTNRYEYNVAYRNWGTVLGSENGIIKMIEIDNGYIAAGYQMVYFDKNGNFKVYNRIALDIETINDSIYTYEIDKAEETDVANVSQAYIVQYNKKLQKLMKISLPFYLKINGTQLIRFTSGFSHIKNRFIAYLDNTEQIHAIFLNAPIHDSTWRYYCGSTCDGTSNSIREPFANGYETDSNNYELLSYKLQDTNDSNNDNSNNNISGIINNIIKNPQTNSIIIIIVFVILILAISIISYFIYKKKIKKGETTK